MSFKQAGILASRFAAVILWVYFINGLFSLGVGVFEMLRFNGGNGGFKTVLFVEVALCAFYLILAMTLWYSPDKFVSGYVNDDTNGEAFSLARCNALAIQWVGAYCFLTSLPPGIALFFESGNVRASEVVPLVAEFIIGVGLFFVGRSSLSKEGPQP